MRIFRLVFPIVAVVTVIAYYFDTYSLPEGATLYPHLLMVLLLPLAAYEIYRIFIMKHGEKGLEGERPSRSHIIEIISVVLLSIGYALTVENIGFLPATTVLMFLAFLVFRIAYWKAAIMAIAAAGLSYGVFIRLLQLPL